MSVEVLARAAVEALVNGTVQGVVLTAGVALVLGRMRSARPGARHRVWLATLAVVVLLPLAPAAWTATAATPAAGGPTPAPAGWSVALPGGPLAAVLALLGSISLLRLGAVARGLVELRRLRRDSTPLPASVAERLLPDALPRGMEIRTGRSVAAPVALGYLRPAVLLPERLPAELGERELRQVVRHEVEHLRRRDDWTKLAQRVAEAVLYFHPAVRWIGRRLEEERELACDEAVVEALGEARGYARCLTRLAESALGRPRAELAPGAAPGASQLSRRIGALLSPAPRSLAARAIPPLLLALLLPAGLALAAGAPRLALVGVSRPVLAAAPAVVVPVTGSAGVAVLEHGSPVDAARTAPVAPSGTPAPPSPAPAERPSTRERTAEASGVAPAPRPASLALAPPAAAAVVDRPVVLPGGRIPEGAPAAERARRSGGPRLSVGIALAADGGQPAGLSASGLRSAAQRLLSPLRGGTGSGSGRSWREPYRGY